MKVKVRLETGRIKLVMDEQGFEGNVLAVLDRYWDSPTWVLEEIRLHPHVRVPSKWFGGAAEDFWASYTAVDAERAEVVRQLLRDYRESPREGGGVDFEWCTYRGIAAGRKASDMGTPLVNPLDSPICCTRAEGLEQLAAISDFWAGWTPTDKSGLLDQVGAVKIENRLLQPTSSYVSGAVFMSERAVDRPRP